jgi:hypothetical protein
MLGGNSSRVSGLIRQILRYALILMVPIGLNAHAANNEYVSWQEEVQLHDGGKLMVWISQRGGIARGKRIKLAEQVISFKAPGIEKPITWRSKYGAYKENLKLLAVDMVGKDVYIVTTIFGMDSLWGHPNPPYVFYKFDGEKLQRIPLEDFPQEITEANIVIDTVKNLNALTTGEVITADKIKAMNEAQKNAMRPYWLTFTRTPLELKKKVGAESGEGQDE